jgi:transaldolase/glucose-6-phosphate isomerase
LKVTDQNPLQQLAGRGQSIWLDFISRELVSDGDLQRYMREDCVTGVTSNPTIFEKAVAEGDQYDDHLRELLQSGVTTPEDLFLGIAISDIQAAADILRPVWDSTGGDDGFVSLEVLPSAAHDTATTLAQARDFWKRVDRPNLMIKVPATSEGVPAIEQLIADGINVNVTLIFAIESYRNVINAYLSGLEQRAARGESLAVRSVASFFVSRVDTEVDPMLEAMLKDGAGEEVRALLGKAAIANAQLAYELFEQEFRNGARFAALREKGAAVQRPLWASTSAKNPSYRDVGYAEALVGPDTVDTMPPATIEAFRDHGLVKDDTVNADYAGAHAVLAGLAAAGIDFEKVTQKLLDAGVKSFGDSYDKLIAAIAAEVPKLRPVQGGAPAGPAGLNAEVQLGAALSNGTLEESYTRNAALIQGLWKRDPATWKPGDAEAAKVIGNRLGWLDVTTPMRAALPRLQALAAEVRGEIADAVLLGMGGSSLCPELFRTALGSAPGQPLLHVLDTTDPAAIAAVTEAIDPRSTLFIVASKSGGTIETLSHLAHFWKVCEDAGIEDAGRQFICITDAGTTLAQTAQQRGFRHIFENPGDIGGRYSALSYFGLVPAAIIGADVAAILDRADAMRTACAAGTPPASNPGLVLGTVMGLMHGQGRDKVTILAAPQIASFSLWAEQLIAESTGKEGRGIVPIGSEPAGAPDRYGDDRLFVTLELAGSPDAGFDAAVAELQKAGQPMVRITLSDLPSLGAEFLRWEVATAVAGAMLGIDPFDEPNVKESKDNTRRLLDVYERDGALPGPGAALASEAGVAVYGKGTAPSVEDALHGLLESAGPGDYVALMAYVTPGAAGEAALQGLRTAIRDSLRVATTLGFGPRFLHSTGQLHKGGPNTGVFLQITAPDETDVEIPGQPFTFSTLKRAQADGDLQSLEEHGRRVLRLHINGDLNQQLARLADGLKSTSGVG